MKKSVTLYVFGQTLVVPVLGAQNGFGEVDSFYTKYFYFCLILVAVVVAVVAAAVAAGLAATVPKNRVCGDKELFDSFLAVLFFPV